MEIIRKSIAEVVKQHYPEFSGEVELYVNSNLGYGDYATSVAWAISKQTKKSPADIANVLARDIAKQLEDTLGEKVETAVSSPVPFININLSLPSSAVWGKLLKEKTYDQQSIHELAKGKRFNLEFISANPTGPLTLANARGGYSGDALGHVLAYAGAEVEREYYYNDSGNQILELGRSVLAAKENREIEGGYKGKYIEDLADKITTPDPYEAGKLASDYIFKTWIRPMIDRMGVRFDRYTSEQSLMDNGTVDQVINRLKDNDLTYEKEGALWLKTTPFGDDKDRVMQRSDEARAYTYLAKDIAYHWDKIRRGYTDIVTMVGADHFTEAKTLERIMEHILVRQTDWKGTFWQPIIQFVRLVENGKEIKMSKRAGTFVTIDDLLDQINSDVARFFFLLHGLNSHLDFDLSLARETSDKNPVFYVQYAYVRAKHILEKGPTAELQWRPSGLNEEERRLLLHIHTFPSLIRDIVATLEIHKLTYYTIELAKLFHAFYAKHPVLQASTEYRDNRLLITNASCDILSTALHLMGVSQPDRMVSGLTDSMTRDRKVS